MPFGSIRIKFRYFIEAGMKFSYNFLDHYVFCPIEIKKSYIVRRRFPSSIMSFLCSPGMNSDILSSKAHVGKGRVLAIFCAFPVSLPIKGGSLFLRSVEINALYNKELSLNCSWSYFPSNQSRTRSDNWREFLLMLTPSGVISGDWTLPKMFQQ